MLEAIERKDSLDPRKLPKGWKMEGSHHNIYLIDESGEVQGAFCFHCRNYLPADNFFVSKRGIIGICKECATEYQEANK